MRDYIVSPIKDFKVFQGIHQAPSTDGWAVVEGADNVLCADHLHVVRLHANPDGSASWVRHSNGRLVEGRKVLSAYLHPIRTKARLEKKRLVRELKLQRSQYTRD